MNQDTPEYNLDGADMNPYSVDTGNYGAGAHLYDMDNSDVVTVEGKYFSVEGNIKFDTGIYTFKTGMTAPVCSRATSWTSWATTSSTRTTTSTTWATTCCRRRLRRQGRHRHRCQCHRRTLAVP